MAFMSIIISIAFLPSCLCLFAYSCDSPNVKHTAISLIDIPSCKMNNKTVHTQDIQVVITQTSDQDDLIVQRCLIKASHVVKRCSKLFGNDQIVGHYQEIIPMTAEVCNKLVTENKIVMNYNGGVQLELDGPGIHLRSLHTLGEESIDGSCSGYGRLVAQGHVWERVVRYSSFEIEYGTLTGIVDFEEKKVILPIGIRCDLIKENCNHGNYGYLFWKSPTPSCTNIVGNQAIVYQGIGVLSMDNDTDTTYVQVKHTGVDFQLKLEKKTTVICGYKSYFSEHPKLFITILHEYSPPFPKLRFVKGRDVNLMNYINSKLVYSMRNTQRQVEKLYHLFERERCVTESKVISNLLSIATLSPDTFAYSYFEEEGYTAVIRGEVLYAAKCVPVVVQPKQDLGSLCYNELVVVHDNKTLFISPRSRILVRYGNIVKCSPDLGPVFKINGRWMMQTNHGLIPTVSPDTIQQSPSDYRFENIESIAGGGIYSQDTLTNYQKILVSPMEETIMKSRLVSALIDNNPLPEGVDMFSTVEDTHIERLGDRILSKFDQWILNPLGYITKPIVMLMAIIFIIKLILSLIDYCVNISYLRRNNSLGRSLVVGFSNALSHVMITSQKPAVDQTTRDVGVRTTFFPQMVDEE